MAQTDRRARRLQEKIKSKDCKQLVRAWRMGLRRRDAVDPELARQEAAARLIVLDLVDLPFEGIRSREEAERIMQQAKEKLGKRPAPPDCLDPRKALQEITGGRNLNPESRPI